jgi:negative regulator of flagellin synthesis FlgM
MVDVKNTIRTNPVGAAVNAKSKSASTDAKTLTDSAPAKTGVDKLTITTATARLRQIEQQISRIPEIDEVKVAEIRDAMRNGSFQIDPRRTAERLLGYL